MIAGRSPEAPQRARQGLWDVLVGSGNRVRGRGAGSKAKIFFGTRIYAARWVYIRTLEFYSACKVYWGSRDPILERRIV